MRKNKTPSIKDKLWAGLTKKQKDWADEYLKTGNATQAYLNAYNSTDNTTARVEGHRLLTNPSVLKYVDANMSVNALTDDWIIKEVMKDITSGDKQSRLNGLNLLAKIRAMVTEKRVNIDEQRKEYGKITYNTFNEPELSDNGVVPTQSATIEEYDA